MPCLTPSFLQFWMVVFCFLHRPRDNRFPMPHIMFETPSALVIRRPSHEHDAPGSCVATRHCTSHFEASVSRRGRRAGEDRFPMAGRLPSCTRRPSTSFEISLSWPRRVSVEDLERGYASTITTERVSTTRKDVYANEVLLAVKAILVGRLVAGLNVHSPLFQQLTADVEILLEAGLRRTSVALRRHFSFLIEESTPFRILPPPSLQSCWSLSVDYDKKFALNCAVQACQHFGTAVVSHCSPTHM